MSSFCQRVQNLDFTIYDSNPGVGGAWYANRYPGLMCDIPSHVYQLTFENNINWSGFYASGEEILQNLESIVDKYQLRPCIRLQHRVTCARYSEETGKWHITIRRPKNSTNKPWSAGLPDRPNYEDWEEFHDTADVLFNAVGSLSRWSWPDIPGLDKFSGKIMHSAHWNTTDHEDCWRDKNVGVIGVGSSAIQIVAALQPKVKHLTNYVRGRTWISSTFVRERLMKLSGGDESVNNCRREIENEMNSAQPVTLVGSDLQARAKAEFKKSMLEKLAKRPWIAEHLIPDFGVACRRLTPGPGYLEALCADNVSFVPSLIKRVTPTGIETADGNFQKLDVIVCATGFDVGFHLDFDVIGRGGLTLKEHHTPHPRTYLSVAVDGFPNMFQALGANSNVGAGNLLLVMERQVDYAVAATLKLQRERLKSIEPKKEAIEDFERYIDVSSFLTIFGTKCRSWYKVGKEEGRVVGLWPGSAMHAAKTLTHPRWEDYNYEFLDGVKNRLHWLGDGNTVADRDPKADKSWYLKPENIDYPPVPPKIRAKL
ncbi:hypothetical protein M413DRAFT_425056 [Hebeloma cylindrosporum]|uniref:L-ornithine N(5)-oxygenase n=1 Tax=Hebeloma cylindrosporum TaxID=76867 RepID=A0A0C3BWA3_HEBCY|nr:hypothetical protein M413DRAFT_425056 [Hebeloma cylindrosporum h7]